MSIPLLFIFITNNELKGTWIGEYSIHPKSELYLPNERILTFNNFLYTKKGPRHELSKIQKGYFMSYLNRIKSVSNSYEIITIENDSLVIRKSNDKSNFYTYRRLPDSLKNSKTAIFVGKKYLIESKSVKDTLYFETDSTFYSSSIKHSFYWDQINHEGFKILFMEIYLPFIIVNQNGDIIKLKRFEKTNDEYTMTELK